MSPQESLAHSSLANVSCSTRYNDQSWTRVFISSYRFTIGFKLGICVEQSLKFTMVFKGIFVHQKRYILCIGVIMKVKTLNQTKFWYWLAFILNLKIFLFLPVSCRPHNTPSTGRIKVFLAYTTLHSFIKHGQPKFSPLTHFQNSSLFLQVGRSIYQSSLEVYLLEKWRFLYVFS